MKGCIDQTTFNRFVEDSLEAEELEGLMKHIKQCESCSREYQSWQAVKSHLGAAASIQVPKGLKDRVMERVSKEKILPAPFSVRKGLALLMTAAVLIYFLLDPFIGNHLNTFAMALLKEFSTQLYHGMSLLGLDPAVVIKLFGSLMARMDRLFWVFASGTLFLIAALIGMILKGHLRARPN